MESRLGKNRQRPGHGRASRAERSGDPHIDIKPSNSFASGPVASRAAIRLPELNREPPVFIAFLLAFAAVMALVLLGGGQHPIVSGVALLIPGCVVLLRPPTRGLGRLGDLGALGLVVGFLLAFVPQFYWSTSEWREVAEAEYSFDLPGILSVQPWLSFEAWAVVLASVVWLYSALQWETNLNGRRWIFLGFSIMVCVLAGIAVRGALNGARYPGAKELTEFSFFPDPGQMACFLVLAGLLTFGYAMEGLRSQKTLPLVGLPATLLCLSALVLSHARIGVGLYIVGVAIWCLYNIRSASFSRSLKLSVFVLGLIAVSLCVWNEGMKDILHTFFALETAPDAVRLDVFKDASKLIAESPLSGVGLGNFEAVFPQYRDASIDANVLAYPQNDWLWLAGEGGLLAISCSLLLGVGLLRHCREFRKGPSRHYRFFCAVGIFVTLLYSFVGVPFHAPGTVFLIVLVVVLAMPKRSRPRLKLPPTLWRVIGVFLVLLGISWMTAGFFSLPFHSSVRIELYQKLIESDESFGEFDEARGIAQKWSGLQPLEWTPHFESGRLGLEANVASADVVADFQRARFAEPHLASVAFKVGATWLDRDSRRAMDAWKEALSRQSSDMLVVFEEMLALLPSSTRVLEQFAEIASVDLKYRIRFLLTLKGGRLMDSLREDLATDPALSQFNREERTWLVHHWIANGNLQSAEGFLDENRDSLDYPWWLRSCIYKERAQFDQAVRIIRENADAPALPDVKVESFEINRLARGFSVSPNNVGRGLTLSGYYMGLGDFQNALPVLEQLLEFDDANVNIHYWRGECLYQMEEVIESWYTFQTYFTRLWGLPSEKEL